MFETLLIGTSGLLGHAKGLRVVGNNLSNVNTPGFKSAQLQFGSLFEQGAGQGQTHSAGTSGTLGTGMETLGSKVNFQAGLDQSTGNPLDVLIDGDGFYTVERDGKILYTRAGDFHFDNKGILVNAFGDRVMTMKAGALTPISLDGLEVNDAKPTSNILFSGKLTIKTDNTISGVNVVRGDGIEDTLTFIFSPKTTPTSTFDLTIKNKLGSVIASDIQFNRSDINLLDRVKTFDLSGTTVSVDLSGITGLTNLDGDLGDKGSATPERSYVKGTISGKTFDKKGVLTISYTNNETATGARLAMANFKTEEDLEQLSGGMFAPKADAKATYGFAGEDGFGELIVNHREGSNVDLASEFSNLILMQRGYQASSHVISTANDMIQELFDMKGHR